jgi:hypothetical protein
VFVSRKTAPIFYSGENVNEEKRQFDLPEAWWTRTFCDPDGPLRRAWQNFAGTHDFEDLLEDLLITQLKEKGAIPNGPIWDIAIQGSPSPGLHPYDSDRRTVFFWWGVSDP